jgi:hypothetical protein
LPTDGVCPECATPVAVSLKSDFLYASDPRWLKTLGRGALFIIYGALAVFISGPRNSWLGSPWWVAYWAGRFAEVIGVWIMTLPDPSGIGEERLRNFRNAARIFFTTRLVIGLIWTAVGSTVVGPNYVLRLLIVDFEQVIEVLAVVMLFFYLGRLMMRIPNLILANGLRWGAWVYAGVSAIGLLQVLPAILLRYFLWRPALFWLTAIMWLPRLVAIMLLVGLVSQCRIAINASASSS